MRKKLLIILVFVFFTLSSAVSNQDEISFSYVLDFTTESTYDVYFTDNLNESSEIDRITDYYISKDTAGRGFYFHIETNAQLDKVKLSFDPFKPKDEEIDLGENFLINYEVSVTNVQNYYSAKVLEIVDEHGFAGYECSFSLSSGQSENTSVFDHYIYRIEYTFTDEDELFAKLPATDYVSLLRVEVTD